MPLSPEYVAGFFDGEGCVNFAMAKYRRYGHLIARSISLRTMVGNTDLAILQELQLQFGGNVHKKTRCKGMSPRARDQWVWSLSQKLAVSFLKTVQPYARVKARQIALALEFAAWREQKMAERNNRIVPGKGVWKRTPDTLTKEAEFKDQLHELNGNSGRQVPYRVVG